MLGCFIGFTVLFFRVFGSKVSSLGVLVTFSLRGLPQGRIKCVRIGCLKHLAWLLGTCIWEFPKIGGPNIVA